MTSGRRSSTPDPPSNSTRDSSNWSPGTTTSGGIPTASSSWPGRSPRGSRLTAPAPDTVVTDREARLTPRAKPGTSILWRAHQWQGGHAQMGGAEWNQDFALGWSGLREDGGLRKLHGAALVGG